MLCLVYMLGIFVQKEARDSGRTRVWSIVTDG
jgi:hypothetical protein